MNKTYWTGYRAMINGDTFLIVKFHYINHISCIDITLPNGDTATISREVADRITT